MFILANLIIAIAEVLSILISAYTWILVARVLISWVNADPRNPLVRIIYQLTEPLLRKIRRVIPFIPAGAAYIDLSPLALILFLQIARSFLVQTLIDTALQMKGAR